MAGEASGGGGRGTAGGPTDAGTRARAPAGEPRIEEFLGQPTHDLARWRWLWDRDEPFPTRSHRPFLGPLLVAWKRLLRPFAVLPLRELWERQRTFNLVVLAHLERQAELVARLDALERQLRELRETVWRVSETADAGRAALGETLRIHQGALDDLGRSWREHGERLSGHEEKFESVDGAFSGHDLRVGHLEKTMAEGLTEVMRHGDALFAVVDQKLDRYRREARELLAALSAALAAGAGGARTPVGTGGDSGAAVPRVLAEQRYLELERRHRGSEQEIGDRLEPYLAWFEGRRDVLDLGCGRGEALARLGALGSRARGVDSSAAMVARCRAQGLEVTEGDLLEHLAAVDPESLDAVLSLHVIEHLTPAAIERLVSLAWRALRPGGILVLETPNPLSLVVGARNFWLDPTHLRPVHPEALELTLELAGFELAERLALRAFPASERLPELALEELSAAAREVADRVNRLRDRLDELLFGHQDYAVVARRPG